MKVKELIEILKEANPDADVYCPDEDNYTYTRDIDIIVRENRVQIEGGLPDR